MTPIGIVPKVFSSIVWIGIIRNTLCHPKLKVSLEKIEIIVRVQPKMLSQRGIIHVLIDEGKTCIWIAQIGFPVLMTETPSVKTYDNPSGMISNQVGNIWIVQ